MKRVALLAALAVMLVLVGGALAQESIDPAGTPNFAELYLEAGFPLDPYLVRVESSGTVDATTVREGCAGVIPSTPDVVVNWTGQTDQLSFFVYSDVDPTLLVVTPSGEILCNDDFSLDTLNPVVSIANPADGPYAVYVGAFDASTLAYGWLGITQATAEQLDIARANLSPMLMVRPAQQAPPAIQRALSELLSTAAPIFGSADLDAGFGSLTVSATGAGSLPILDFPFDNATCDGFINLTPSYRFDLASDLPALTVLFNGEADAVLAVRLPDGTFVCNSQVTVDNLNPALSFENAAAGDYTVWIGSRSPADVALGTLVISEDPAAQPDVLPAGQ